MMAPGVGSACRVEASKSTASCFFWWDDQPAIPQASKTGEEPGARQGLKNNCSFVSKSGWQTIRRTDKATLNERLGCAIKNFTLCAWTMCHLHTFLCLTIICATWSSTCPLHFHSLLLNMGLNYLYYWDDTSASKLRSLLSDFHLCWLFSWTDHRQLPERKNLHFPSNSQFRQKLHVTSWSN